MMINFKTCNL